MTNTRPARVTWQQIQLKSIPEMSNKTDELFLMQISTTTEKKIIKWNNESGKYSFREISENGRRCSGDMAECKFPMEKHTLKIRY